MCTKEIHRFDLMKRFLFLNAVIAILTGCVRSEEFPPEPVLKFKSIRTTPDSAVIVMSFSDGDGDFGLRQSDTTGIFADCLRRYNLYCEYYELENGEWQPLVIDPCLDPNAVPFFYRIPWAEPTGQIKSQEGEIQLVITPFYFIPGPNDTCRFEIQAIDRSQNLSNVIRTSAFRKPD
jgi:hypothetical protein